MAPENIENVGGNELRVALNGRIDAHYDRVRDRLDELDSRLNSKVESAVSSQVRDELDGEIRSRMRVVYAFTGGFLLFLTLGLLQSELIFHPLHRKVYQPQAMFQDLQSSLKGLTLEDVPNIERQVPELTWETLWKADKEDFSSLLENGALYDALHDAFRSEIVVHFGTPEDPSDVSAREVMKYQGVSIPAVIKIVSRSAGGRPTKNCAAILDHDYLQAILITPRSSSPSHYRWLGCDINYPEVTLLTVEANGRKVSGVRLVEVATGSQRHKAELRVTRSVAEALQLPGFKHFSVKSKGAFSVEAAKDNGR